MNRAMTHGFVVAMLGALASVSAHAASINSIYDMDRMLSEPHPLAGQYGTRWNPATVAPPPMSPPISPEAAPGSSNSAPPPGSPAPLMAPQLRLDPGTSGVPVQEPRPAPRPSTRPLLSHPRGPVQSPLSGSSQAASALFSCSYRVVARGAQGLFSGRGDAPRAAAPGATAAHSLRRVSPAASATPRGDSGSR
mgnify:CR=1 FL=1